MAPRGAVYGARLDITTAATPGLSETLKAANLVTFGQLVNLAGSNLAGAGKLAERLGMRSTRVAGQMLERYKSALTTEDWRALQQGDRGDTDTGEQFPRLLLGPPTVEGSALDSIGGKGLYRLSVEVLNRARLDNRADTPWRANLGMGAETQPAWRDLYRLPLPKECQHILNLTQDLGSSKETFGQFEGGVKLGIGSFNLMLSLLPGRVLRLLEFIGFSGNREFGLSQLREGAASQSLRAILSVLTLLLYHTYVSLILGTGEGNLVEAETLLEPYLDKFPKAEVKFQECIAAQQEWKQVHHLCYWELMWSHSFQQEWLQAYRYADLLCKESRWSKAIYVYQKAAILSMLPEAEAKETGENVVELFRQVEGLKQRLAGKSIPTEKFAVRKSRRYSSNSPVKLVIPALEMMYVWNGFTIVGKRADMTEGLLVTIETAEQQLGDEASPTEYHPDDQCLVQMLKGLCLKHLGRLLQAELCFTQVLSSERRIRYDHYLVPFTLYELGLLYKQQGDIPKATRFIENAKLNYKDYSMESRLHFRIHAALSSLKSSPVSTP
ncbi:hypothetical protein SKAU_G00037950 [Synaphobranchus kaupii]|uniref:Tetratricopeptide repeat protein 39B n=1 Tax=Synaphobranchus kaupii TaxID=118154 RepID=A0A9Q1GFN2_SYNKA|nr:hypothetical protein SKAU_G00037950 [Synaphobranchus kaupii]